MFIMELPPYRMPSGRSLAIHTWEKGKHFLIKAGTYILAVSVLVWFLLNLPWGVEQKKDSYLGTVGQAIAPVFKPLGFGTWEPPSRRRARAPSPTYFRPRGSRVSRRRRKRGRRAFGPSSRRRSLR